MIINLRYTHTPVQLQLLIEALTAHISSLGCLVNMTFDPQRPVAEQRQLTNKWNEMGTDEPGNTYR